MEREHEPEERRTAREAATEILRRMKERHGRDWRNRELWPKRDRQRFERWEASELERKSAERTDAEAP